MSRLTIKMLHDKIGITPDIPGYGVAFGPRSRDALRSKLTNMKAPAITNADFVAFASLMGVPVNHVRGVRKVEAPRGAYTDDGIPSPLYERHVAYRNAEHGPALARSHPSLFYPKGYGRGGYGAYSAQFDKVVAACAFDPYAAFAGASWGAFQVLGENAEELGYDGPFEMVLSLVESEAAHLECFRRYITVNGLLDEFQLCRPGDPDSCIPFVRRYNGPGYAEFNYHVKLANAIKG